MSVFLIRFLSRQRPRRASGDASDCGNAESVFSFIAGQISFLARFLCIVRGRCLFVTLLSFSIDYRFLCGSRSRLCSVLCMLRLCGAVVHVFSGCLCVRMNMARVRKLEEERAMFLFFFWLCVGNMVSACRRESFYSVVCCPLFERKASPRTRDKARYRAGLIRREGTESCFCFSRDRVV